MAVLRFASTIAAVAALSISIAGCRKDARDVPPASAVVVRDTTPVRDTVESGGEVVSDPTIAPVAGIWITDANTLSLFGMMNSREIAAANRYLERYRSDSVRVFAEAMIREHSGMQHSADSVAAVTRIAPVPSALAEPIGAMLQTQSDSVRGGALDRAFLQQQIATHEVMATYIEQFSAAAERGEVQAMMSVAAGRVRSHIVRARGLQAMLAVADSVAAADSAAKASARTKRQSPRQ